MLCLYELIFTITKISKYVCPQCFFVYSIVCGELHIAQQLRWLFKKRVQNLALPKANMVTITEETRYLSRRLILVLRCRESNKLTSRVYYTDRAPVALSLEVLFLKCFDLFSADDPVAICVYKGLRSKQFFRRHLSVAV